MRQGEFDIGFAHLASRALLERIAQHLEALGRKRGEQAVAVGKVPVRRVVRDPRAARQLP